MRLHHLLDDPVYVLSRRQEPSLADLRDATWITGCERCRSHLLSVCANAGFDPRIGYTSDDMVVMQALVAAGLGVATQSGLAMRITSTASSQPNYKTPSGTSTPPRTASHRTRPQPPPSWRPSPRPPGQGLFHRGQNALAEGRRPAPPGLDRPGGASTTQTCRLGRKMSSWMLRSSVRLSISSRSKSAAL